MISKRYIQYWRLRKQELYSDHYLWSWSGGGGGGGPDVADFAGCAEALEADVDHRVGSFHLRSQVANFPEFYLKKRTERKSKLRLKYEKDHQRKCIDLVI